MYANILVTFIVWLFFKKLKMHVYKLWNCFQVNNWEPENYEPEEVPDEIKDVWQPNVITVKCFGEVSKKLSPERSNVIISNLS